MTAFVGDKYQPYTHGLLSETFAVSQRSGGADACDPDVEPRDMQLDNLVDAKGGGSNVEVADGDFQKEAIEHIRKVRDTLVAMLQRGGMKIQNTRDVHKHFGVSPRLSWEVFKLAHAHDLMGAVEYVPPSAAMSKLMSVARKQTIPAALIADAKSAYERFEEFVALHAGDRSRFESMVATLGSGDDAEQAALRQRKLLFKAHAFMWGLELGTAYGVNFLAPSAKGAGYCDDVQIMNLIELNRLRPNADTRLSGGIVQNSADGQAMGREPLDPEAMKRYNAPVLPLFSGDNVPKLSTRTDQYGHTHVRLAGTSVGLTKCVNLAFGEAIRDTPAGEIPHTLSTSIIRPTRVLCMEHLIHHSLYPALQPEVHIYGHISLKTPPDERMDPAWELPCHERVTYLPRKDVAPLLDVPQRQELLTFACKRMGWVLEDFDVYRLRIEYPVLDTLVAMDLRR